MTPNRAFKSAIYEQLARVAKALASPLRLELLDLLAQGPKNVDLLARQCGQSRANTSQHLQVLRSARLVEASKSGLYVTYRLASEEVADHSVALRRLAEARLTEIESITSDYLSGRGQLERVDGDELVERVRRGEVTVLDVRPAAEYAHGHLPGALSVPLSELEHRLDTLPRDREVVAYCRGPYCVYSVEAVELLRARGFTATRLDDGVHEWRARGGRVAVGGRWA
jgi:rhodanese-related sulfurtransferase/DNA-binding transcriptional ArsR family regulator